MFESTELDVAEAFLRDSYSSTRLSSRGEHHRMRVVHEQFTHTWFTQATYHMQLEVVAEPLGVLALGQAMGGGTRCRNKHGERAYRRGMSSSSPSPTPGGTRTSTISTSAVP